MDEAGSYPPISPTAFDLIVVGTGLPESILSVAASATGKIVPPPRPKPLIQLFILLSLSSFLSQTPHLCHSLSLSLSTCLSPPDLNTLSLDLTGPRVLFCADELTDLIIKSGASNYIEFKSIDTSYIYREGELCAVPDSRSAVFRDSNLGLSEKTTLGSFFMMVESHLRAEGGDSERIRVSDEDLESPFVEFLNKMLLSNKIKS